MKNIENMLLRVPEVALLFWIVKSLSTTVGETTSDFFVNLGLGMPLVAIIVALAMGVLFYMQFGKYKKYIPVIYWTLVVLMSIEGTLITDMLVDTMGVSLITLTIVFSIAMLIGFALWHKREGTLSIHSINTTSREAYYWVVILIAFALGTAAGDLISEKLSQGYGVALALFAGLIVIIAVAHYLFKLNSILAFWLAYILTRPLGASLGDYLSQSPKDGGLGFGLGMINIVFFSIIVGSVFYMHSQINKNIENFAKIRH
ncbi:MAG: hypothetical protein R3331_01180 [Sulfurospirillaceae bacterium]|nr:hypothetical protein [Sulfurospirillaceae bacterium]